MARKSPATTTEDTKMTDTASIHPDVQLLSDYAVALEVVALYNKRKAQVIESINAQALAPTDEQLEGAKATVMAWIDGLGMRPRELASAKRAIKLDAYTFGGAGEMDVAPEFFDHLNYTAPDNQSLTPVYTSIIKYITDNDEALPEDERYFLDADLAKLHNLFFPRPTVTGRAGLAPTGLSDKNSWMAEYHGREIMLRIKPDNTVEAASGIAKSKVCVALMEAEGKTVKVNDKGSKVADKAYLDAFTTWANEEAKRLGKTYTA